MKLSERGLADIQQREGERLVVYRDTANNPTVCMGHLVTATDHLTVGDRVSPVLCEQFAHRDLGSSEDAVNRLVKVSLTQNQFDALVSFTFNEGNEALSTSTLLRMINAGNFTGAQAEFVAWRYEHVNGVKRESDGLLNRRLQEAAQFGTPDPAPTAVDAAPAQQAITPAPVLSSTPAAPPPTKVIETRTGRALIGSAASGGTGVVLVAGAVADGINKAKPALDAIQTLHAATADLPVWLLLVAGPLALIAVGFALYGIWHKQRSLQGAAP